MFQDLWYRPYIYICHIGPIWHPPQHKNRDLKFHFPTGLLMFFLLFLSFAFLGNFILSFLSWQQLFFFFIPWPLLVFFSSCSLFLFLGNCLSSFSFLATVCLFSLSCQLFFLFSLSWQLYFFFFLSWQMFGNFLKEPPL